MPFSERREDPLLTDRSLHHGAYTLATVCKFAFTGLAILAALAVLATACTNENGQEEAAPVSPAETVAALDVSATVSAVLTRVPRPTPTPEPSASDIVAGLVDGLVQIVTPDTRGSGFVISNDGLIVTNAHLLEDHDFVTVRSVDGWSYAGMVMGKDEGLDLAVVKVTSQGGIRAMPLGDESKVRPGDPVIAMGFPLSDRLGKGYTITTGVVSSLRGGGPADLVQTDAAINPGSSGGPLVNSAGQVIGVNTSTFREYASVSFAISIGEVKDNLLILAAGQDALFRADGEFENYKSQACQYSLRAPSEWTKTGEGAGCQLDLERYDGDDLVGTVYIRDYPLNHGETLDEFSAWWSEALMERAGAWSNFDYIYSGKSTVERNGGQQQERLINYRWQETEEHCGSFATDKIVVASQQRIALVFHVSICDFMPPSALHEIADMEFYVSGPTPVSEPTPDP